jgi:ABC-2 type transport system permease protein
MKQLRELLRSRELLSNLTLREIRGKYKRTVLGQLWSLANPLSQMLIYTFIFSFVFRVDPGRGDPSGVHVFALWLLCGLLPWGFFSSVVGQGMGSLIANAGLIQKVYFPRLVIPVSTIASIGFNWLFEMAVLLIALSIFGSFVLPWIPALLVAMVLLALFSTGLALMLSIANVYFRDTQYFMGIILQIWMYLTPIIYPISLVHVQSVRLGGLLGTPVTLEDVYGWNPLERFVGVFRNLLYDNRFPDAASVIAIVVWAAVSLVVGLWVFGRHQRRLAEVL